MKAIKVIAMMIIATMLLSVGVSAQFGGGGCGGCGGGGGGYVGGGSSGGGSSGLGWTGEDKPLLKSLENTQKVKKSITKKTQKIQTYLKTLRKHIEDSKNLDKTSKNMILNELDEYVSRLEQREFTITTIESKEQLNLATEKFKEEWEKTLLLTKKSTGLIKSSKINNIIVKTEKVKEKLTARMAKLTEAGFDTSALEESLESFDTNIDFAKQKHEEAMAKFVEADTVEDAKAIYAEIKNLLKESNQSVREAYKNLKTTVSEMTKVRIQKN